VVLADIEVLRKCARADIQYGCTTIRYRADRKVVVKLRRISLLTGSHAAAMHPTSRRPICSK
jgi:hypothetical protein